MTGWLIERIVSGKTQLVFISPQTIINNQRYREMLLSLVYKEKLVAVAIDEAHLVKEWLSLLLLLTFTAADMDHF